MPDLYAPGALSALLLMFAAGIVVWRQVWRRWIAQRMDAATTRAARATRAAQHGRGRRDG